MSDTPITPNVSVTLPSKETPRDEPKRGPGRPRKEEVPATKAATGGASSEKDIKQALAVLDSAYGMVTTGLMLGGFQGSLAIWADKLSTLREQNEANLRTSPKLVKTLVSQGEAGGTVLFLIQHAVTFGTLGLAVRGELAERRAYAEQEAQRQAGL